MRSLLQEKFLGAFLGGLIGEQLSNQEKLSLNRLENSQISWLENHQKITAQMPLDLDQSLSWKDLAIDRAKENTISEIALVILPIILYYHDNLHQLEFSLRQAVEYWQVPLSYLDGILWWSVAIALILREKLNPEDLWQQLTITTQILETSFGKDLTSLEILFNRGLSITEVKTELSSVANLSETTFLLSLYCFSQTPENFMLTIKQAWSLPDKDPNLLALTGFLSGAYNSRSGLPVNWEKFCQNGDAHQKIWQLGKKVFALWSGVYDGGNDINHISAIVTTPRTLQNRSYLEIISQQEYESK